MENASKALIMAAGVILGILILTFLVFIFGIFSNFSKTNRISKEEQEISNFNAEFFKYYEQNVSRRPKLTAHDIVSIGNYVKENNSKYGLTSHESNTYYVTIDVFTNDGNITGFEKKDEQEYLRLLEKNRVFVCTQITINNLTKRVEYVKYEEV